MFYQFAQFLILILVTKIRQIEVKCRFFFFIVYVIITMFCLASFTALYSCFDPLVMLSYTVFPKCPIYNMPKIKCCGGKFRMELRQFILACFSLSVTIVWAIFRKASWAWILQDILGIFFSINMLKTLRLPSLKIITVLLCTLFVYDIFFVFVTPLFTKVSFGDFHLVIQCSM